MVDSYTRMQFENLQRMYRKVLADLAAETAAREAALTSTNGDLSTLSGTVSTLSGTVAGLPALSDAAGVKTVTATHAHVANSNPATGENTTRAEVTIDCGTNKDSLCIVDLADLTDPSDTFGPTVKLIPIMATVGQKLQVSLVGHATLLSRHQHSDQVAYNISGTGTLVNSLPGAVITVQLTRVKAGAGGIIASWGSGPPSLGYRYIRLKEDAACTDASATDADYLFINELEYLTFDTLLNPLAMTSDTVPYVSSEGTGQVAGSSSAAFNKSTSTSYESTGQSSTFNTRWIQLDLGASAAVYPTAVRLSAKTSYTKRMPGSFRILASNDASFSTYATLTYIHDQASTAYSATTPTTFQFSDWPPL